MKIANIARDAHLIILIVFELVRKHDLPEVERVATLKPPNVV